MNDLNENTYNSRPVNLIQELYLQILEAGSFNDFNGSLVGSDLRAHTDWWRAVIAGDGSEVGLALRDLPENETNFSTVHITAEPGRESDLWDLAERWLPDECDWIDGQAAKSFLGEYQQPLKILRLWWD